MKLNKAERLILCAMADTARVEALTNEPGVTPLSTAIGKAWDAQDEVLTLIRKHQTDLRLAKNRAAATPVAVKA